jgi:hypothetical protein
MMWNKKSQILIYGLMLSVTIIILAMAIAPAISESSETARNVTNGDTIGLDCTNSSISNFDKATCVVTDINTFYFVGSLIMIGGIVLISKIIFE